jgi:NAD(P)H-dependent flavin oxidoreductase YrpB (nitropropane dioxygenase family)
MTKLFSRVRVAPPVAHAPMIGGSTPRMAATVSNAGGQGDRSRSTRL